MTSLSSGKVTEVEALEPRSRLHEAPARCSGVTGPISLVMLFKENEIKPHICDFLLSLCDAEANLVPNA